MTPYVPSRAGKWQHRGHKMDVTGIRHKIARKKDKIGLRLRNPLRRRVEVVKREVAVQVEVADVRNAHAWLRTCHCSS